MRGLIRKLSGLLILLALFVPVQVQALTTYFNDVTREYISRGVVFEESRRITSRGLLNIFILRLPADDPNILLSPASSQRAPGLKEPASRLLEDTGAIAGINGDFFGLAGQYSMPAGLQINTNGVLSVPHNQNYAARRHTSFMLAADGNYFMDYVNASVRFFNNGQENILLGSMNKVADLAWPTVITSDFMADTSSVDARIEGAVKIVVNHGIITHISAKGETVAVPPSGYVILMNSALADLAIHYFAPGQRAELVIDANLDIWSLQSAISGGARILEHGRIVMNRGHITGVHPRTAIGLSADGREIILMVVDGRGNSAGVNHEELGLLMLEAGAYNAMHLDGGGSSQMVVSRPGNRALSVVSNPSGGFERRIINALGVYTLAPIGQIHSIVIDVPDTVIRSIANRVTVFGLDEYMRRIDLPQGNIRLEASPGGFVDGEAFIAYNSGFITLTAHYGFHSAQKTIYATELFEIRPNVSEIRTSVGGMTALNFTGVGRNGNVFDINPFSVQLEVFPPALGSTMDAVFTAASLGSGWLRASVGQTAAYIPLYATIVSRSIDSLSGDRPISFSSYPSHIWGGAFYTPIPGFFMPVATLMYSFNEADYTQAAYADFQGLVSQEAMGYRLAVFGDLSGLWLRGRVLDANGREHLIDFARVIDWEGWRDVEVWLPANIAHPVTLRSIYVAATSTDREISGQIYFSNLRGLYDFTWQHPEVITPPSSRFRDSMQVVFYEFTDYGYDITFMPSAAAPAHSRAHQNRAMDVFLFNASVGIYMGAISPEIRNERQWTINQNQTVLMEYRPNFEVTSVGGLYIIQLTASGETNSGLMFADRSQWARLQQAMDMSHTTNIALLLDQNPLNFTNSMEFEILHRLLRAYVQRGYNVFVLSSDSRTGAPSVDVIDGVRYMAFGPLYSGDLLNEEFSVLRFRLSGNDMKYSIENIFH